MQIPSVPIANVLMTFPNNYGQSKFGRLGHCHGHLQPGALIPITLIDTKILDHWCAHPRVWEVMHNMQHPRQVLAIVHPTIPEGPKGKPVIVFRLSLVYIQPVRCEPA